MSRTTASGTMSESIRHDAELVGNNKNLLMIADLHFTNKPEDEYRFDIFDWITNLALQSQGFLYLVILGDLTDAKDRHPASLVNQIVTHFNKLRPGRIYIVKGNHDYVDSSLPYFSFLNLLVGVTFFIEPEWIDIGTNACLMLPHTNSPYYKWNSLEFEKADYIFLHQTIEGSMASNGHLLKGMPRNYFSRRGFKGKGIFSGDVHVPQILGDVTYVGSPYHVHYGDSFKPRAMLLDLATGHTKDFHFPAPQRRTLNIFEVNEIRTAGLKKDDQVKVRMWLDRAELSDWEHYKREILDIIVELGLKLGGLEMKKLNTEGSEDGTHNIGVNSHNTLLSAAPERVFDRFTEREEIDPYTIDVGEELLKGET